MLSKLQLPHTPPSDLGSTPSAALPRHNSLLLRSFALYTLAIALLYARAVYNYSRSVQLNRRGATTDAICRPEFGWMNNSKSQSPCLVAEYLHAPCEPRGNGNVSAIVDDTYRPPTAEGAEACGCSWALYNTLQACAVCQSDSNFAFSTNCSSQLKQNTEFYSSNEVISEQTAVQLWATRDTSTWDSGMFNSTQAEAIASECKEDITQENREAASGGVSASTSGSSTVSTEIGSPSNDKFSVNVGAIAGGVASGVIAIAGGGLAGFFMRHRKKKLAQEEPNMTILPLITPGFSEPQPMVGGYTDLGQSGGVPRIKTASNLRFDLAKSGS